MTTRPQRYAQDVDWGPARSMVAVTPSDTVDLPDDRFGEAPTGIYVGQSGNIVARFGDDTNVTIVGAVGGTLLPIRPTRIMATGTTASSLLACY